MGLITFILFGLIVGFLARAIMPGKQSMGLVATTLLGIAGALLGGLAGSVIHHTPVMSLRPAGIIGSLLGALLILFLMGYVSRRRVTTA